MNSSKKSPADPLRADMLETLTDITDSIEQLRDYAIVPCNIWLAKNELQKIAQIISELEDKLEELKRQDAENGY